MTPSLDDPIIRWRERERAFLMGAPLAVIPALAFLPAITFLIVFPQVAHGRVLGAVVVPACALTSCFGLWKLALGAVQKPWGIFNVLSFWHNSGPAGDCRIYGAVSGTDDIENCRCPCGDWIPPRPGRPPHQPVQQFALTRSLFSASNHLEPRLRQTFGS